MTNGNINVQIPKRAFNKIYIPYIDNDSRYLIFYGGAGSGKSFFIAERYIIKLLQSPMCNLLICRAIANTNRDSTFALLKQVISKWGLTQYFKIKESDLRITCLLNNNSATFKGLDDTEKLKSITFSKGELTDIWIEEATETDEESFNQLDVRLRGKGAKKQIVLSFNPINVNHWLKKRFVDKPNNDITFLHTTYKDNDFLDNDYKNLLENYADTDPYYYSVYCLGQWGVYGKTIFNATQVNERIVAIKPPIKQGYFIYDYNGLQLSNIKWVDDVNGYIKIYKDCISGYPYVIGGDTSGDGSDNFAGQVLDNTTGEQAATLKHKFDEDLYAKQMYCLGQYYNNALIGIESNFSSYPIRELQRLNYTNMYYRETIDKITDKYTKSYGFKTTSATRPVIIAELVKVARDNIDLINDYSTLDEMLTFVRNEKGRPEAQNGAHDDMIMSLAIAHFIRPQQSYNYRPISEEKIDDSYNDYSDFINYGGDYDF